VMLISLPDVLPLLAPSPFLRKQLFSSIKRTDSIPVSLLLGFFPSKLF